MHKNCLSCVWMSPQGTPRLHPLDSGDDDKDSDLGMALTRSIHVTNENVKHIHG